MGQRKRRTKRGGWNRLHHQLAPILITLTQCVLVHIVRTHTNLCLSDTFSSLPYHLLALLQMKRIGGVVFECGNALAKNATSINTTTCIQRNKYTRSQGKYYTVLLIFLELWGGVKHGFKGSYLLFYHPHLFAVYPQARQETRAQEDNLKSNFNKQYKMISKKDIF